MYKPSGVEWLGDVPEHWTIISIKWLSPVKRGASPRPIDDPKYFDDEGEFAWVRIADVSACDGLLNETTQRLSDLGSSLSVKIAPGDLFVSIAGTVGKPCLSGIKACIHDGFVYFPTLQFAPKFLYRIFEAGTCYGGLGKWGTQLNLNTDTIGSIRVAIPRDSERTQILEFLDRETSKIDGLVGEQRRLIELLKEKRQAVISHAVTKGLNPHAPLKPSGIEWLGDVPEHWEVLAFRRIMKRVVVGIAEAATHAYAEEGVPIVRSTNIKSGTIDESDMLFINSEFAEKLETKALRSQDIVTTRTGANVGVSAVVPESLHGSQCFTLLISTPVPEANPQFYNHYINSGPGRTYVEITAWGSGQPNISVPILQEMQTIQPPQPEQEEIVAFIECETAKLDALTAEAERGIELLQERRTALISAAVTGQIDVRNFTFQEQT